VSWTIVAAVAFSNTTDKVQEAVMAIHKQKILEDVYEFCDLQHELPTWHEEPHKGDLFRVFVSAQESDEPIPADVIHVDLQMRMERLGRWDSHMQGFVRDMCEVWTEWEYAIKHFTAPIVDVGGSG
jgi:hypothetical protein